MNPPCVCLGLIESLEAQITEVEDDLSPWPRWVTHWVDRMNADIVLVQVMHEVWHAGVGAT